MNKRIKELADQVLPNEKEWHKGDRGYFFSGDELEKFAGLIVQDCIAQVALLGISNYENDDISWTVDMAIKNIRHRLGVE